MKTIRNALKILALFKDTQGPLGVGDIAQALGYNKSYVSRVLATMRELNYLNQDPETRKYTVGIESFALGARYVSDTLITRTALPIMREMSDKTGDSVFLTIRHGRFCRHILAVEGPHFTETRWRVGVRLPLHASASGKALLAFESEDEREHLIHEEVKLEQFTPMTIATQDALREELRQTRERGYSTSRQELVIGLAGWAAPVYGEDGKLIAALSIIMPEAAACTKDAELIVHTLHDGARRLSALSGVRVYPH